MRSKDQRDEEKAVGKVQHPSRFKPTTFWITEGSIPIDINYFN